MLKKEKLEDIQQEHQLILDCMMNRDTDRIDDLVHHHLREDINSQYLQENFSEYIKS
ncbi:hypothetical protein D3C71_1499870 [compost metagenome]